MFNRHVILPGFTGIPLFLKKPFKTFIAEIDVRMM